jgi:hypothetical protein
MRNTGKILSMVIIAILLGAGVFNFVTKCTSSPEQQVVKRKSSHVMINMEVIHREELGYFSPGRRYVVVNAYTLKDESIIIEKPFVYSNNAFSLQERNKIMQFYDSLYREGYRIAGTSVTGELIFELK